MYVIYIILKYAFIVCYVDPTLGPKSSTAACYVSINPLDTLSSWICTKCDYTVGHEKIRELEEMALKTINSGILYACLDGFALYFYTESYTFIAYQFIIYRQ